MFSPDLMADADASPAKRFRLILNDPDLSSPGIKRLAAMPMPFDDVDLDPVASSEGGARRRQSRDSGVGLDTSTSDGDTDASLSGSLSSLNGLGSFASKCHVLVNVRRTKRRRDASETRRLQRGRRQDVENDPDDGLSHSDAIRNKHVICTPSADDIKLLLENGNRSIIGDFSRSYCLPTVNGKHSDLKSVAPSTLARLVRGEYSDVVGDFGVIDCRYPYEYEGGHVKGAQNIWNPDRLRRLLSGGRDADGCRRRILIFHCEFSSERGPKLCRLLRQLDRDFNRDSYPGLCYPELYLLDGGYKAFYAECPELCEPRSYLVMMHPDHSGDLKHFRIKSKSCSQIKSTKKRGSRLEFF